MFVIFTFYKVDRSAGTNHIIISLPTFNFDIFNNNNNKKKKNQPWRRSWWSHPLPPRILSSSAWPGHRRSQWVTPSSPQWGKQPSSPCRRRWWWVWKTTRFLLQFWWRGLSAWVQILNERSRGGGEAWYSTRPERGQHPGQARPLHLPPGSHSQTQTHRVGRVDSFTVTGILSYTGNVNSMYCVLWTVWLPLLYYLVYSNTSLKTFSLHLKHGRNKTWLTT